MADRRGNWFQPKTQGGGIGIPSDASTNWRFTDTGESLASTLQHGALTSITGKTASNAVVMVTKTRPAFESVIVGQRTLADATQHHEITTIGDAKAISDLFALVVDSGRRTWTMTVNV